MSEDRRYDTPYTPPDNGGNLRINRYKRQGSKEPDLRGEVRVNGVMLEIAGWERRDRNNNVFWSLKFSPPRERAPRQDAPRRDLSPAGDDIPF